MTDEPYKPPIEPTLGEIWSSTRQRYNTYVRMSQYTSERVYSDHPDENIFDVSELQGTQYEPYASKFEGISRSEARLRLFQLAEDMRNQQTLDAAPWWKELPVAAADYMTDPATYLSGAVSVAGVRALGSLLSKTPNWALKGAGIVLYAGADWAIRRGVREATSDLDPELSYEHLFIDIAASIGLPIVGSKAMEKLKSLVKSNAQSMATRLQGLTPNGSVKEGVDKFAMWTGMYAAHKNMAKLVGMNKGQLTDLMKRYSLRFVGYMSPANKIQASESQAALDALRAMKTLDLIQDVNFAGDASETALETLIHIKRQDVLDTFEALYKEGWTNSGVKNERQYSAQLAEAFVANGKHANTHIENTAKKIIKDLADPTQAELQSVDLVGAGKPVNAEQYYPQRYDYAKIIDNDGQVRKSFHDTLATYIEGGTLQAKADKARLKPEIVTLKKDMATIQEKRMLQKIADKPLRAHIAKERAEIVNLKGVRATQKTQLQKERANLKQIRATAKQDLAALKASNLSGDAKKIERARIKGLIKAGKAASSTARGDFKATVGSIKQRIADLKQPKAQAAAQHKISQTLYSTTTQQLKEHSKKLKELKEEYATAAARASLKQADIPGYVGQMTANIAAGGVVSGDLAAVIPGKVGRTYKKERMITIPQSELLEFLDDDFYRVFRRHLMEATADVETAKIFGKQLTFKDSAHHKQLIAERDKLLAASPLNSLKIMKEYANTADELEGILLRLRGRAIPKYATPDGLIKSSLRIQRAWKAVAALGSSSLSLIPDLASACMVDGIKGILRQAMPKALIGNIAKLRNSERRMLGLVARQSIDGLFARGFMDAVDYSAQNARANNITHFLDKGGKWQRILNGAVLIDQLRIRLLGTAIQHKTAFLCHKVAAGTIKARDKAFLLSLGIDDAQALKIFNLAEKHGNWRQGIMGIEDWGDPALVKHYQNAVNTFLLKTSTTLQKVDLPFLYDNAYVQSIMQFTTWIPSFVNKIIIPGVAQRKPEFAQTIAAALALGALTTIIKHSLLGSDDELTSTQLAKGAVRDSGMAAFVTEPTGRAYNLLHGAVNRDLNEAGRAFGPGPGMATDIVTAAKSIPNLMRPSKSLTYRERMAWYNLSPFHNIPIVGKILMPKPEYKRPGSDKQKGRGGHKRRSRRHA